MILMRNINFPSLIIGFFFVLAFFDLTIKSNIYILIPLIVFFYILIGRFSYYLSFTLPLILIGFVYLFYFGFDEFFRFQKTFLLVVPITYLLFVYKINLSNTLRYFLIVNVFIVYLEFIVYNLFGIILMPNTSIMIGWPRYHAFFPDSNFFSYTILCYVVYDRITRGKYNLWMIGSIFISLSISAILVLIFFYLFYNVYVNNLERIKYIRTKFLLVFIFSMTAYFYFTINADDLRGLSENESVQFKIVSMSIRLDMQSQAIKNIFENNSFFLGLGSGAAKTLNEFGLNLHNTYLQAFLESGFFVFSIILIFFLKIFFEINILFLPFLMILLLLGNILEIFYFPLVLFIFYLSRVYDKSIMQ